MDGRIWMLQFGGLWRKMLHLKQVTWVHNRHCITWDCNGWLRLFLFLSPLLVGSKYIWEDFPLANCKSIFMWFSWSVSNPAVPLINGNHPNPITLSNFAFLDDLSGQRIYLVVTWRLTTMGLLRPLKQLFTRRLIYKRVSSNNNARRESDPPPPELDDDDTSGYTEENDELAHGKFVYFAFLMLGNHFGS